MELPYIRWVRRWRVPYRHWLCRVMALMRVIQVASKQSDAATSTWQAKGCQPAAHQLLAVGSKENLCVHVPKIGCRWCAFKINGCRRIMGLHAVFTTVGVYKGSHFVSVQRQVGMVFSSRLVAHVASWSPWRHRNGEIGDKAHAQAFSNFACPSIQAATDFLK